MGKIKKRLGLAILVTSLLFVTDIIGQVTSAQEVKISNALPKQVVKKPKINWPKTVIDKKRGLNYVQSICFIRYRTTQF